MITTILSQRSFDNSWASPLSRKGDKPLPTGVVVDLCVTYSASALNAAADRDTTSMFLQVAADDSGKLRATLSASIGDSVDGKILGSLYTDTTGLPVALDCIPGVYCSVLFGFVPKVTGVATYDPVQISDELVVAHTAVVGGVDTHKQLALINTDSDGVESRTVIDLDKDKKLELGHGVIGAVQDDGSLQVYNDPSIYEVNDFDQQDIEYSTQRLISAVSGAKVTSPQATVRMSIRYAGELLRVTGYPSNDSAKFAVIYTHGTVSSCDSSDPVDMFVGPASYHEGVQVLDELYTGGVRDITNLFKRTYGWGKSAALSTACPENSEISKIDETFDNIEESVNV